MSFPINHYQPNPLCHIPHYGGYPEKAIENPVEKIHLPLLTVRSARRIIKYFLCAGLRIKGEKESCKQDSPPAAGRDSDTLPPPPQCDYCFFPIRKKAGVNPPRLFFIRLFNICLNQCQEHPSVPVRCYKQAVRSIRRP